MKKTEVCELIREIGVIPAVRVSSAEETYFAARKTIMEQAMCKKAWQMASKPSWCGASNAS